MPIPRGDYYPLDTSAVIYALDGDDVATGGSGDSVIYGDTVIDFADNGAAAGDLLQFVGYGAGASFTNIDATHWQVNFNDGASHEVITFMNGASIDSTDVLSAEIARGCCRHEERRRWLPIHMPQTPFRTASHGTTSSSNSLWM
jgi:hypothetical protein